MYVTITTAFSSSAVYKFIAEITSKVEFCIGPEVKLEIMPETYGLSNYTILFRFYSFCLAKYRIFFRFYFAKYKFDVISLLLRFCCI